MSARKFPCGCPDTIKGLRECPHKTKPTCGVHGIFCVFKCVESDKRYRILRFYSDGRPAKRIKIVGTLELAKLHCSHPETRGTMRNGVKWFDGFTEIK